MTAVDVNPRPWAGRSSSISNVGARGRRWVADLARRNQRQAPIQPTKHGITVNGLSDPYVTVLVTFAGQSQSVAADDLGKWTASFESITVPEGTIEIPVRAAMTDASGHTNIAEGVVQVET